MGRAPCCDKANVKKGPWSPEEDAKLKAFIEHNGTGGNWITLPSKAGLKRCGKSCRLRWINYLRPDIKHGSFTEEEERIIYQLHASIGSRWSLIAAQLPGRTDNDIKNYWNTRLKKKLAERSMTTQHQQRSYHMQNLHHTGIPFQGFANPAAAATAAAAPDGLLQQMVQPQMMHYYQQYNTAQQQASQLSIPTYNQQHMQNVKNELVDGRADIVADERLMMIESSLRNCIAPSSLATASDCITRPIAVHQSPVVVPMSPIAVSTSHHPSPASSCSGISSDRSSYGTQLADSAFSDSFNSRRTRYEDSPGVNKDTAEASALLSCPNSMSSTNYLSNRQQDVLAASSKPQILSTLHDHHNEHHSAAAATVTTLVERYGLPEDILTMGAALYHQPSSSIQVLSEAPVDRQVKEESQGEWWAGLISPRNAANAPRACTKWTISSPRCGADQSTQLVSQTQTLDPQAKYADHLMFKNYVAI